MRPCSPTPGSSDRPAAGNSGHDRAAPPARPPSSPTTSRSAPTACRVPHPRGQAPQIQQMRAEALDEVIAERAIIAAREAAPTDSSGRRHRPLTTFSASGRPASERRRLPTVRVPRNLAGRHARLAFDVPVHQPTPSRLSAGTSAAPHADHLHPRIRPVQPALRPHAQ